MFQGFLIKYSEIGIKGKNRYIFEDTLVKNIKHTLKSVSSDFVITKEMGRIYVQNSHDFDYEAAVTRLKKVFGIWAICPMYVAEGNELDDIAKELVNYIKEHVEDKSTTFKICARRSNKKYPLNSMELNVELGGIVLDNFPEMNVDVHHPKVSVTVEVRDRIYIYEDKIKGAGGLPLGTAGRGMLLLSGGIDSPVAGYMISRRGVELSAVYFDAPPYTSARARDKVIDLAKLISQYCGSIKLHVINFTDIQLAIYDKCPHDELTIIMRRIMMKIAENIAVKENCQCLITGESIGQVASQTLQSLMCTDQACNIPVYRPLIAFDKQDIIDVAIKIDTYETSILPYEDCCTIFVDDHPVTKPVLSRIQKSEEKLDGIIDDLINRAIENMQIVII